MTEKGIDLDQLVVDCLAENNILDIATLKQYLQVKIVLDGRKSSSLSQGGFQVMQADGTNMALEKSPSALLLEKIKKHLTPLALATIRGKMIAMKNQIME